MNESRPTGRSSKPETRVDTLTLLQRTRATSENISALDLVFDPEDYFNYTPTSHSETPEKPYRCPSPDLGKAKAGFKFNLRSLSFKEMGTSISRAQSPLRQCHYPDTIASGDDHKEKKWGLAMKVGGLLSTISRRHSRLSPAVSSKNSQSSEPR